MQACFRSLHSSRALPEWSELYLHVCSSCKHAHVLHPETEPQREKINASGVTRPSPSTCAHVHRCALHTQPGTSLLPHTHSAQPDSFPPSLHAVWNIDVLFKSPPFCLCHNPSIYTPFLTTPSAPMKTVQHCLSYHTVVYTIITPAQMAFCKLRVSSSSHYNEAILLSTECQFVSFHVINKSDVPHWLRHYSNTLMFFIKTGNPLTQTSFSGHFCFHLHRGNFCVGCTFLCVWSRLQALVNACQIKKLKSVRVCKHQLVVD